MLVLTSSATPAYPTSALIAAANGWAGCGSKAGARSLTSVISLMTLEALLAWTVRYHN